MKVTPAAKKEVGKGFYAAVGALLVVGLTNAFSMYQQAQIFKDTATTFMQKQTDVNSAQQVANSQFQIAIAQLTQQSKDQNERLNLLENRVK